MQPCSICNHDNGALIACATCRQPVCPLCSDADNRCAACSERETAHIAVLRQLHASELHWVACLEAVQGTQSTMGKDEFSARLTGHQAKRDALAWAISLGTKSAEL
ncbi:MAG: hypothetical protein MJE77_06675 [Proteobacteria bacterium]|nr:hypothetical protein [Pseudomonadota bacterium]